MAGYGFSLLGVDAPQGQDPLGIWEVSEAAPVAYSLGDAPPAAPAGLTWRVELPAAPQEAQSLLSARAADVQRGLADLASVQRSLETFSQVPSFAGEEDHAAQKNALRDMLALHRPAEVTAYGLGDLFKRKDKEAEEREQQVLAEERDAMTQWESFVQQVQQTLRDAVRIETVVGGRVAGVTRVSWGGDFATFWGADLSGGSRKMHAQSLRVALDSRTALLRVTGVVVGGAAGLAAKAGIPGGPLTLLPAAWKYVRDVLAELRRSWPQLKQL
ncbi:MAG: hypothetical protein JXA21_06190 [Anaerolineae bacterium]|nr:hypothetical protein [Anaerolineae bacterium]